MTFRLILHAVRIILRNFGMALRVSVAPFAVGAVMTVALLLVARLAVAAAPAGVANILGPVFLLAVFATWFLMLMWVAMSWHRFILVEDRPALLPHLAGRPVRAFVGKSVQLLVLFLIIAVPLLLLIALVGISVLDGERDGGSAFITIAPVLANLALTYVVLRWSIALPATAVGRPMGFGAAWQVTARASRAILGIAVVVEGLNWLITIVVAQIDRFDLRLGLLASLSLSWVLAMFCITLATVLYGHLVEERTIPA